MSIDTKKIEELAHRIATTEIYSGNAKYIKEYALQIKNLAKPRKSVSDLLDENTNSMDLLLMRAEAIFEGVSYFGAIVHIFDGETSILSDSGVTVNTFDDDVFPDFDSPKMTLVPESQPEDERIAAWGEIAGHKFFNDCYRDGVLLDHMIKKLDEVELRKYPLPSFVRPAYHRIYGYGFTQRWPNSGVGQKRSFFFSSDPGGSHEVMIEEIIEDDEITYLDQGPIKLSTQQDYREAPVGTVVQHSAEGSDVFIKTRELIWRNINSGVSFSSFKMSGDIREIMTVIEVK